MGCVDHIIPTPVHLSLEVSLPVIDAVCEPTLVVQSYASISDRKRRVLFIHTTLGRATLSTFTEMMRCYLCFFLQSLCGNYTRSKIWLSIHLFVWLNGFGKRRRGAKVALSLSCFKNCEAFHQVNVSEFL